MLRGGRRAGSDQRSPRTRRVDLPAAEAFAKRTCACVGGSSNVPLGFVSLTENLMMVAMAVWMALAPVAGAAGHG